MISIIEKINKKDYYFLNIKKIRILDRPHLLLKKI